MQPIAPFGKANQLILWTTRIPIFNGKLQNTNRSRQIDVRTLNSKPQKVTLAINSSVADHRLLAWHVVRSFFWSVNVGQGEDPVRDKLVFLSATAPINDSINAILELIPYIMKFFHMCT